MLKIHEIEDQVRNFVNEKIGDVIYLTVDFDTICEPGYTEITYVVTVKTRYPYRTLKSLFSLEEEGLLEGEEFERNLCFQLTEDGVDAIHGLFGWCESGWFSWKINFENCYIVLEIDCNTGFSGSLQKPPSGNNRGFRGFSVLSQTKKYQTSNKAGFVVSLKPQEGEAMLTMNVFEPLTKYQFDGIWEGYSLLEKAGVEIATSHSFEQTEEVSLRYIDFQLRYIEEGFHLYSERGDFLVPLWLFRALRKHVKKSDREYVHSDTLIYEFRTGAWCRFSTELDN